MTQIKISNKKLLRNGEYTEISPTVYRTATAISLEGVSFIGRIADVTAKIEHFQDAERTIKESTFEDRVIKLGLNNSEPLIDKRTGQYSDETTPPEYIQGEFDFFLTQKIGSIEEMLIMGVLRADTLNRFD